MKKKDFAAIDLGASNGRIMAGKLADRRLEVREIYRFEHCAAERNGKLRWDWALIRAEVRRGLAMLPSACSVSCCSWAQDFGLLDDDGRVFCEPVSYRDPRTQGMPDSFRDIISSAELTRRAGVGAVDMTTLCQLRAMAEQEPATLARARTLLHVADLMHYDLCGKVGTDWTMASAAQMCNRDTGCWDNELVEMLGIPSRLLPPLGPSPVLLGNVVARSAPTPAWNGVPVVLGAGHDTPCAFHVLPAGQNDTLFISCGTWAMLGCRLPQGQVPDTSAQAVLMGVPGGEWGAWRGLLGLWLIQCCRRTWRDAGKDWSPEELTQAAQASGNSSLINMQDSRFAQAPDVPVAVRDYCVETGQAPPVTPGDTARIIYRSLARACGQEAEVLRRATGRAFRRVRLVGGGARNEFLRRLIADECGLPLEVGPLEATVAGNLLLQIQAVEGLSDNRIEEIRDTLLG